MIETRYEKREEVSAPRAREAYHDARHRGIGRPKSVIQQPTFSRAVIGFMILGIVLRLVRYLQNYPMWCDETMLAANLLDRHWNELAQPLAYRQVCPVGFLALEWAVVRLLGFSELSLRFIPVLCGLVSVPLFGFLARRLLGGESRAYLLAVALFAVSEPPIRYAAEVKPYSPRARAAVSATHPLRCVLLNRMPTEVPGFLDWIESHRDRYTLREVRTYPATRGSTAEPAQTYVVCEFVPTVHANEPSRTARIEGHQRQNGSRRFRHKTLRTCGRSIQFGEHLDTISLGGTGEFDRSRRKRSCCD